MIIAVIVVVMIAIWVLFNVVIPLVLLNLALIFAIAAHSSPTRRSVFAVLALAGVAYLLADVANGWWSADLVTHVVKSPSWLTAIIYINAAAAAVSLWLAARPLFTSTHRPRWMPIMTVITIAAVGVVPPLIWHTGPNAFRSYSPVTPVSAPVAASPINDVSVPVTATDTMSTDVVLLDTATITEPSPVVSAGMLQPAITDTAVIAPSRDEAVVLLNPARIDPQPDVASTAPAATPESVPATATVAESQAEVPAAPAHTGPPRVSPADSIEAIQAALDGGGEVSFPVKANVAAVGYVFLRDGTVTLTKSSLTISLTFNSVSVTTVPVEKIVSVNWREPRLNLRVLEMKMGRNFKMREGRQDYELYDARAVTRGVASDGRITTSYYSGGGNIVCNGCGDALSKLSVLLERMKPAK